MIFIRKNQDRGKSHENWLNSLHTFSFGQYYDPEFMGFNSLRVINEDTVQPGFGFGKHPHRDMEILSYVVEGSLEHKDSMGTGSIIKPGEVQLMTAGTGVEHSEFNHSKTDRLHFLQIWIIPEKEGLKPGYQQEMILRNNQSLILIGSPQGGSGVITMHQNVNLYAAYPAKNTTLKHSFNNREGWVQMVKGKVRINSQVFLPGDGAAIQGEKEITLQSDEDSELLLFDFGAH